MRIKISEGSREAIKKLKKSLGDGRNARNGAIVRKVALQALGNLQALSPVDSGLYRGSHQLSIGEPAAEPPAAEEASPHAQASLAEQALKKAAKLSGQVTIYISNALPYAQALENGHSQQAPAGIYAVVRQQVPGMIRDAIAETVSGQSPEQGQPPSDPRGTFVRGHTRKDGTVVRGHFRRRR